MFLFNGTGTENLILFTMATNGKSFFDEPQSELLCYKLGNEKFLNQRNDETFLN